MSTKNYFGYLTGARIQFYIEWKIDYGSIKSQKKYIFSPKFDLFDSTWHLNLTHVTEDNEICLNVDEYIGLWLEKLEPTDPYPDSYPYTDCISGTLGIKANDGSIFKYFAFTETSKNVYIGTSKLCYTWDIADGIATFFCGINHPECKVTDAESQTSYCDDTSEESKKMAVIFDEEDTDVLRQSISGMLTKGKYYDVILKVGENEFKAHKDVLAARSQVFAYMFEHDMMETRSGIVNIKDCDKDEFQDFLQYIYSAEVESITTDKMLALYCIANKYDVKELKKSCLKFLTQNLSADRFGDTLALALKYDEKELIKACEEFFVEDARKILVSVNWQLFIKDNVTVANELFVKYTERNK